MRVSSVIFPSASGTLKSTRMKTRLPESSKSFSDNLLTSDLSAYRITSLMRSRRRTLKPHSLSYQANTFSILSPSAFVSGPSTIDE